MHGARVSVTLRWRHVVVWLAVATIVLVSIAVRLVHRGPYFAGWDLMGAAHGLNLVSTHGPWEAVVELWTKNRHYGAPFPYYSAIGALIPGALSALAPWDQWAHVVTFVSFLVTLALVVRATGIGARDAWVVPLAWSASPTLLTLAICGYPWATAFLPHALALCVVLDPRLHRRPVLSLVLALLSIELAWHCYEPGKTVGAVFVAGALLAPGATLPARFVWLAAGAAEVAMVFYYPSMNVGAYVTRAPYSVAGILEGLRIVASMTFVQQYLDLPVLVAAGMLACLVPSRRRLLVAALMALQIVMVAVVAVSFPGASHVRPRRFVMVDCYALVMVALLVADAAAGASRLLKLVRTTVVALLVVGSAWQLLDLARFVAKPFPRESGRFAFTLPYSHSQVDYMMSVEIVDWAEELIERVERGERLVLAYNLDAYDENLTNPSGVLERLYLRVGHDAFVRSVLVFGSHACRQSTCLPVRPLAELEPALDELRREGPQALARLTGFAVKQLPSDGPLFVAERARILAALEQRFTLRWEGPEGARYRRFSLAARSTEGPS
jgi:hypothetical protein